MPYYVVSNNKIITDLARSSVFRTDLGYSATLPSSNGMRKINGNVSLNWAAAAPASLE